MTDTPTRDRHLRRLGFDYGTALLGLLPYGQAWPRIPGCVLERTVRGLAEFYGYIDCRAADLLERESDPRKATDGTDLTDCPAGGPDGLLSDWERNWGLPDPCYPAPTTIEGRQLALIMRMTMQGAQSREFFIGVAKMLGYDITITEYRTFVVGMDRVGDNRVYGNGTVMYNEWGNPILNPRGEPVKLGELSEWPYYGLGPPENRYYWSVNVDGQDLVWFRVFAGMCGIDPHLWIEFAWDVQCILERWKPAHTQIIFNYTRTPEMCLSDFVEFVLVVTSANATSVPENTQLSHTLIANTSATWSIVGGPDAARFEIVGTTLRWLGNGTKDFEQPNDSDTNNIYLVSVRATAAGGYLAGQTISVSVTDVPDMGITSSAAIDYLENTLLAHSLTATEPVTWSIVGGADMAQFEISGSTLRWLSNGTRDYESLGSAAGNNVYVVQVRATSVVGALTANQTITVTVVDVVEWVTFASGTNSNIILSDSDLGLRQSGAVNALGIASAGWKRSGKHYFEAEYTSFGYLQDCCGIAIDGAVMDNLIYGTAMGFSIPINGVIVQQNGGRLRIWGYYGSYTDLGNIEVGEKLNFAVDLDNYRFWVRKWTASPIWNPADKRATITLSENNTKAEVTSGGGVYSTVRSTLGKTNGKFYFEVRCIGQMSANMSVGIANSSASLTSYLGDSNNSISLNMAGSIFRANSSVGGVGGVIAANDVISVAVDLTSNNMIWFRVNGGNWNNSAVANPATNVGGIDISAISGTKYVAWNGYTDFSGAPPTHDTCTANFGHTAFAYAVPANFNAGWVTPAYWNNNASADPATNVGGLDISFVSQTRVAPCAGFISSRFSGKWLFNTGDFAFSQAVPTGFAPGWSKSVQTKLGHTAYTRWDTPWPGPASYQITELGERLWMNLMGYNPYPFCKAFPGDYKLDQAGKYYIEMHPVGASSSGDAYGVTTTETTTLDIRSIGAMAIGSSGDIYANGIYTGWSLGGPIYSALNGNLGIAVDLINRKVWFRLNGGNWNGQSIHNPSDASGGADISALLLAGKGMLPFSASANSFDGTRVIANFGGGAPFLYPVPAGFTAGWPKSTDTTPPFITSSDSISIIENQFLQHRLIASEFCTWSIVGGTDAAKFTLAGTDPTNQYLTFSSGRGKNFEAPDDANADNVYQVIVRATDLNGNVALSDQTISVTVNDSPEVTGDNWYLAASWIYANEVNIQQVDFLNLGGFSEIRIVARNVSGAYGVVRVSTNNGSTFMNTSGDYVRIWSDGTEDNQSDIWITASSSGGRYSGEVHILGFNLATAPKLAHLRNNTSWGYEIIPTTTALNAVRVVTGNAYLSAGNSIRIFGR